jgi:predicted permease
MLPFTTAIEAFGRDLRHSARGLLRSPGFTLAVTLTLGLGIGANAAMLGAIDRLMFRPFAYLRDPGAVHRVYFQTTARGQTTTRSRGPYTTYLDLERSSTPFAQFAAFTEEPLALGDGESARERMVAGVSASFFDFFDARPRAGRFFGTSEDALPRGANVAVLGYAYWQTEFGGQNVIGRELRVGPLVTTIVGVAPKDFVGVSEGEPPSAFVPITTLASGLNQGNAQSFATKYNWTWMNVMVRRKPGVSATRATADLTNAFIASREKQRMQLPSTAPSEIAHPRAIAGALRTLAGPDAGIESKTLFWVTGVAAAVLLIACANIANLLLVRQLRRRRELAVRIAMGMNAGRLASAFAAEGLLLAMLGCVAGIVVAQAVSIALASLAGANANSFAVDWRTALTAAALALAAGVATYIVPALTLARGTILTALRAGARGGVVQHARLQATLLVVQGTLSVVLLVGAGLFVRSFANARSVHLGWNPEPVVVVTPNYRGFAMDSTTRDAFREHLLETARNVPGVAAAARVDNLPFATSTRDLHVDGIDSLARLGQFISQVVSPEYFKTLDTRIVRGRALDERDRFDAPLAAVVSEAMGSALWPGRDPLGQCIHVGANAPCTTVVGVAEDVAATSISDEQRFTYYLSDVQPPMHPANRIFVRVNGDVPTTAERLRRALQREMPGQAYVTATPLENVVDAQWRSWKVGASMFVAFGALALVVAAVGLYGVIGYQAAQRRHEFGVRIALGAQTLGLLRLVMSQAVTVATGGVVLGVVIALGAGRWLQPLLFRESVSDPGVLGLVAGMVIVVAMSASAIPGWRAARADPMVALKSD